jgi:hypothetical protein
MPLSTNRIGLPNSLDITSFCPVNEGMRVSSASTPGAIASIFLVRLSASDLPRSMLMRPH